MSLFWDTPRVCVWVTIIFFFPLFFPFFSLVFLKTFVAFFWCVHVHLLLVSAGVARTLMSSCKVSTRFGSTNLLQQFLNAQHGLFSPLDHFLAFFHSFLIFYSWIFLPCIFVEACFPKFVTAFLLPCHFSSLSIVSVSFAPGIALLLPADEFRAPLVYWYGGCIYWEKKKSRALWKWPSRRSGLRRKSSFLFMCICISWPASALASDLWIQPFYHWGDRL